MRRLSRGLFAIFAAASLFLCHAVCVLWARSYTASDGLGWNDSHGQRSFRSARGAVEVVLFISDRPRAPVAPGVRYWAESEARGPFNFLPMQNGNAGDELSDWQRAGFAWHERRNERLGILWGHGVAPFWSVATATALPPLAWVILWRAHVRRCRRENLFDPAVSV